MRSTLIASLLFNCFESFHGYHECAIQQVKEGLREIGECFEADGEGVAELLKKLDEQAVLYANTRNAEIHELYRKCGQESIDKMPRQFSTLAEARILLEIIIRRSVHWLASTIHLHDFSETCEPWSLFDVNPPAKEKKKTLYEYERWRQAYEPLLESEKKTKGGESFVLAMTLRLHWLAGYLTVASNASDISLDSGRFAAELEEIVSVSGLLLVEAMKTGKPYNFAFDMQVIVPLTTVGWIYRHRALRRKVITLLQQSPRKEGVWDGVVIAKVLAWLVELEEDGLADEEYIPINSTARMIRMTFNAKAKVAEVSCLKPVRGAGSEKLIQMEAKIPW
ncbi:hypothetical protein BP6252_08785 [Coleophoma cylindrospora]|uniref:Uncharacterized protein n=1 Tax=Coleophoma cylindrospora TaxID=1849047 RepID=A0A3D8R6U1_9HELO|nr:hypothetical protein BP6252_08785 [Coleophoma cylindrospora]